MSDAFFAIYYKNLASDKDESFRRAAETWARKYGPLCQMIPVTHVYEFVTAFRQLAYFARSGGNTYSEGALFIHSSPPGSSGDTQRGIHLARFVPKTMAELRYREEVLVPQGIASDTLTPSLVEVLERLPWSVDARLYINGCLTGYGRTPVAKLFADSQGVITVGQSGKAYFSKRLNMYEQISPIDKTIYLKAFYRAKEAMLDVLSDKPDDIPTVRFNMSMPEKVFTPQKNI